MLSVSWDINVAFYERKVRGLLLTHCLCFISFLHLPGNSEEMAPPLQQNFMIPRKEINMVSDMGKWKRSQVCLWVQGKLVSAYYVTVAAESGLVTASRCAAGLGKPWEIN